ncbi:O-antigen ligase family protein [Nibrella viscosa]|uniref:O-antigen ligase family protein n=1 Tax=Nibrella viscosa TaxID=1084524 RepID=A0ABP8KMV9_9BACT
MANSLISEVRQGRFWITGSVGIAGALLAGFLIATAGYVGSAVVVMLPLALLVLIGILLEPRFGMLVYLQYSFLINVLGRFAQIDFPFGVIVDGILVLTALSVVLNGKRMEWHRLNHPTFYLLSIWFMYTLLQLFNPEAPNKQAWLIHARPFSLHWFFVGFIMLVTPIQRSDMVILLRTWLIWSLLAALWAFKQQYIGLTPGEQLWLDTFGAKTHLLFGHLRSFSFYSDASQFGAEMAGVSLICLILLLERKQWISRLGYLVLILIYFWGYAVSGTRSALFILLAGYPFYLLLKRDFTKILAGGGAAAVLLGILLYTNIGNDNYQIFRIRTALRPLEDASFLVRLENQQKLANYLQHLPFGAGIGTSGDAGARFSPDHFAAQIPPDSWFVELWIETGIVGLTLYILMLLAIIGIGTYKIWHLNDPWLRTMMYLFIAEFTGVAVMGYSNPVIGQFPTSSIVFISSILFTSCDRWDTPVRKPNAEQVPASW